MSLILGELRREFKWPFMELQTKLGKEQETKQQKQKLTRTRHSRNE
jgi:hypothetical protein